jgi:predicted enzyme related to lactoylglutathione lyase
MRSGSGLVYVFLYAGDLARTRRFYSETLGLAAIEESDFCTKYDTGGTILALNPAPPREGGVSAANDSSSLLVFHVDDVDASRRALERRGVLFAGDTEDYEIGKTATFYDPDGHGLCIYEPSRAALTWPSGPRLAELARVEAGTTDGESLAGRRLVYLFLFVRDVLGARQFYEKQLGLPTLETDDDVGVVKYDARGVILATHRVGGSAPSEAALVETARAKTLAPVFYVEGVEAQTRLLGDQGVPVLRAPLRAEIGTTSLVADPNGHALYLYEASAEALTWPSGDRIRRVMGID